MCIGIALLLSGCTSPEYKKQESLFLMMKTPTFKYADLGFMYENENQLKIELYSSGNAIMALEIGERFICTSAFQCLEKQRFNKEVLSPYYPSDILFHILKGQPIVNAKNLKRRSNGFTQHIVEKGEYNIKYQVLNSQVVFRDTINDIVIKLKRLK
jgi:hypothetical protein